MTPETRWRRHDSGLACSDDAGWIGEGLRRRAIIDLKRFEERLAAKAATKAS